jgi:hypothetical protein
MVVAMRLMILTISFLGVFMLYRNTLSNGRITVFQTVYTHCILVLVTLVYYCLFKLFFLPCKGKRLSTKQQQLLAARAVSAVTHNYHPQQVSNMTDMIIKVPRLTIQNVWILVYGLGLVFFITGYCFLGLHPVCLTCAGFGVGVISVDELVCPRVNISTAYMTMRFASLFTTLLSLALISAELFEMEIIQYLTTLDLYSIFFGVTLPFGGQFIMIAVRDNRRHTLATVFEVCEFGFPFATFLGIFHLSVAYGQRFQITTDSVIPLKNMLNNNHTIDYYSWYHNKTLAAQAIISSDGNSLLFYLLAPLLMVPGMISYVTCILEGTAVEPLLSLTLTLCIEHLIQYPTGPASPLGIAATVLVFMAIGIRIMCEYETKLKVRDGFQMESTQLPYNVVWGRDRLRAREAEELTRDFELSEQQ